MLISSVVRHLVVFCFFDLSQSLQQLSEDIAQTDKIRDVVNQIFSSLKLKTKKDSKLKEYSTIHKLFVSLTKQENDSWKKVAKLTTLDSRIENGTTDFTTIINDILNEENKTTELNETQNDADVNEYIENFLSTLARLKEIYLVNNSYSTINTDVLEHLYRTNDGEDNNHTAVGEFNSTENISQEIEFWTPSDTRRIFRGQRTKIKYFPFLVSVHLFNQFTCAGSIIQSSLVITAASCLQLAYNNRFYRENPAFLSVRIGSPFYNGGGESIPVIEVYFHPTYTPRTLRDNLAIMRLERRIKFKRNKRNVRKIDFDRNDWGLPMTTNAITIAGWGAKTTSNKVHDPWSNKVSMAILPIYPLEDCQEIYSKDYVGRKNFCAGFLSKGGGACNRDVGAPGIVHGILIGVVSFGAPTCGTVDAPTVFTKLGYYYDWIETIMEQRVPQVRIRTTLRPVFVESISTVTLPNPRDFKIEPINFKNIKSLGEIEKEIEQYHPLRMEQNTDFENFLETMFNTEDLKDYKVKLPNVQTHKASVKEENKKRSEAYKAYKELTRIGENAEAAADENFKQVHFVTSMGTFDPEETTYQDSDIDINFTKLDKISQMDEVDDDTDLEIKGATPILEEYGLSIEVLDNPGREGQYDITAFDNERKHQTDIPDKSKKYLNVNAQFNNEPKHQAQKTTKSIKYTYDYPQYTQLYKENKPQVQISDDTLNYLNSHINTQLKHQEEKPITTIKDVGSVHQFNEKRQHKAEELEELEDSLQDDNDDTQFKDNFYPQVAVSDESDTATEQQVKDLDELEEYLKDVNDTIQFKDKFNHQVAGSDESSKLGFDPEFTTERKYQLEKLDASLRDADTFNNFNENRQHQVKISEEFVKDVNHKTRFNQKNTHQIDFPDKSVKFKDVITQLKKERKPQQAEPYASVKDVNTKFYKKLQRQLKERDKFIKDIDDNTQINKESKYQTRHPDVSVSYMNANTEFNKVSHYQLMKPDESVIDIDYNTQFNKKIKHQAERNINIKTKFNKKRPRQINNPQKFTKYIDDKKERKYQIEPDETLRGDKDYNQLNKKLKHKVPEDDKNDVLDEKLEEQIDQLLKNLDFEKDISLDLIEQSNDRKVIDNTKLLELIERQDQQRGLDPTDENIYTLLFLSENEHKNETTKPSEKRNKDKELNAKERFSSIDGERYEDLTHRTNMSNESYNIMSKNEMYEILVDAIRADNVEDV